MAKALYRRYFGTFKRFVHFKEVLFDRIGVIFTQPHFASSRCPEFHL